MEFEIKKLISEAIKNLGLTEIDFSVGYPDHLAHGDYASNVALVAARTSGKNPREVAELIKAALDKDKNESIDKIEIAGPGFLNFYLSKKFFSDQIKTTEFPSGPKGQRVLIEYTDPNPFKEFHIGHLMSNTIGESIARLHEFSGAEVRRANYQGDVGLQVAKAIWGKLNDSNASWGQAYVSGTGAYEKDEKSKKEIAELNKKIYERSNPAVNKLYDQGKKESLENFEKMYERLGTKFDYYFFESEVGPFGKEIVEKNLGRIFKKSEGAVIFPGEEHGPAPALTGSGRLHTRVFITKEDLPTYEAKELGLAKIKYDTYPYDQSIVVTANEINDYFRVLLAAMEMVFPELAAKTSHIGHGMMRFASGKMSSREGVVISAETLIDEVKARVRQKMAERKVGKEKWSTSNVDHLVEQIAIGAIKYSILKQSIGHDIVFDFDKSISFEGDSGPYLQYAFARTQSLLEKARSQKLVVSSSSELVERSEPERLLHRFAEIAQRAQKEHAPQLVVTFLTTLAGSFNSYYAKNKIVDEVNPETSQYRLALSAAVGAILKTGLWLLGIQAPGRM